MTSKAKILAVSFFIWLGKKRKRGKNMETKEKNVATPYDLDGKPPLKLAIPLGLQHVLAMFVGNLTPLLIITGVCGIESGSSIQVALLQNAMLVAGIVTLIQVYTIGPIGGKLPIVMGTSSGFIGVCRSVAITMGSGVAGYGAVLAACFIGGLVAMNKVVNRYSIGIGGIFLIACGLFPKLAALISIMPQSVLGGAAVMMFSSIVVSGIQLITKWPMSPRNVTIVSVALGVGYGLGSNSAVLAQLPESINLIFGGSGIVPAALFAIILNIVLPKDEKTEVEMAEEILADKKAKEK